MIISWALSMMASAIPGRLDRRERPSADRRERPGGP
jgi:hypothetical protein